MTTPPCLKGFRAAIVFLTRVPVGGFPYSKADWRWAAAYFPAVGALVGAIMACVFWMTRFAGPLAAGALSVVAGLLVTGAFHEDGLADTADGLGGGYTTERILEILKDSRIGTFGSAALTCSLLLRAALAAKLDDAAPVGILLAAILSRAGPVWLMRMLPYVTRDQAARSRVLMGIQWPQVVFATGTALLATATVCCAPWSSSWLGLQRPGLLAAFVVVAAAGLVVTLSGLYYRSRVRGITGDFLGASQQLGECTTLLALAWLVA